MARAVAIEPDVVQRLLAGESPRQQVRPIKTGIPMIDRTGMMEVNWYTGQLKRIGRGEAPCPNESALWVFLKTVFKQMSLGRKKRPTRLRATP